MDQAQVFSRHCGAGQAKHGKDNLKYTQRRRGAESKVIVPQPEVFSTVSRGGLSVAQITFSVVIFKGRSLHGPVCDLTLKAHADLNSRLLGKKSRAPPNKCEY